MVGKTIRRIARVYFLLNKPSEEQKLILLQQLLQDKTVDYIFKLIADLPDNQRLVLMKQLEDIQVFTRNKPRVYEINS